MDIPENFLPRRQAAFEYAIATHVVDVAAGVTPEMALDPNFWAHLAERLKPGHEVIVRPSDLSFRLHAQVVAVDPSGHWAVLDTITLRERTAFAKGGRDEGGYRIDHDPVQGWRILNGRDLVVKDLPDEAAARRKLAELKSPAKKAA